jgi:hypothetical protein
MESRKKGNSYTINLYLFHGKLSIGAEDIGLGARMYKNNCAQALRNDTFVGFALK